MNNIKNKEIGERINSWFMWYISYLNLELSYLGERRFEKEHDSIFFVYIIYLTIYTILDMFGGT